MGREKNKLSSEEKTNKLFPFSNDHVSRGKRHTHNNKKLSYVPIKNPKSV